MLHEMLTLLSLWSPLIHEIKGEINVF